MFSRRHGWTAVEIGHSYGLLLLVFGTAGVLMGGWLGDVMTRRNGPGGRLRIAIAVKLLTIPFIVGYTLLPDGTLALLPLAASIFLPKPKQQGGHRIKSDEGGFNRPPRR